MPTSTPIHCVDVSGVWRSFVTNGGQESASSPVTLTQQGCSRSADYGWQYSVTGTSVNIQSGTSGTYSKSGSSESIQWSNDLTYRKATQSPSTSPSSSPTVSPSSSPVFFVPKSMLTISIRPVPAPILRDFLHCSIFEDVLHKRLDLVAKCLSRFVSLN